ncbi:hypothetical protein Emin_0767 [Elusimicrobium minutum Pei191]|uniref:Uncharacterized protein n=1 Tax=Elusimicrobium minutum (strain Pei191) TaxID=445932 RepID=B2KCS6_ELUMP|nr:hypothetical protein [Elusimicrobium minutum]ACC98322.1 hypothetical protein Emin_0767 [Elusimicrobium minutum Pei191]
MKKKYLAGLSIICLLSGNIWAAESMEMVTYYPTPYAAYSNVQVNDTKVNPSNASGAKVKLKTADIGVLKVNENLTSDIKKVQAQATKTGKSTAATGTLQVEGEYLKIASGGIPQAQAVNITNSATGNAYAANTIMLGTGTGAKVFPYAKAAVPGASNMVWRSITYYIDPSDPSKGKDTKTFLVIDQGAPQNACEDKYESHSNALWSSYMPDKQSYSFDQAKAQIAAMDTCPDKNPNTAYKCDGTFEGTCYDIRHRIPGNGWDPQNIYGSWQEILIWNDTCPGKNIEQEFNCENNATKSYYMCNDVTQSHYVNPYTGKICEYNDGTCTAVKKVRTVVCNEFVIDYERTTVTCCGSASCSAPQVDVSGVCKTPCPTLCPIGQIKTLSKYTEDGECCKADPCGDGFVQCPATYSFDKATGKCNPCISVPGGLQCRECFDPSNCQDLCYNVKTGGLTDLSKCMECNSAVTTCDPCKNNPSSTECSCVNGNFKACGCLTFGSDSAECKYGGVIPYDSPYYSVPTQDWMRYIINQQKARLTCKEYCSMDGGYTLNCPCGTRGGYYKFTTNPESGTDVRLQGVLTCCKSDPFPIGGGLGCASGY